MLKLKFIGWQEDGFGGKFQLWNVFNSPDKTLHPDGSTVSLPTVLLLYNVEQRNKVNLNVY